MLKPKLNLDKARGEWRHPRRSLRYLSSPFLVLLAILFSGCSRIDADSLFTDYQQRLSRVLQLADVNLDSNTPPPLPAIRQLRQQVPESKLNLVDLVTLRHCNLQQLVAERNNSLGKVMTSANQLGYELQLLIAIKPCLQHPKLDPQLQAALSHVYQQKQQQLPIVLQNFLTTDTTLRKQLTGQPRLLTQGAAAAITEPLTALKNLNQLKKQVHASGATTEAAMASRFDAHYINQQLGVLYRGNYIADWQYSLRQSNRWLALINQQLSAIPPSRVCPQQRVTAKTEILNNILTQIFIPRVQSYLAELDRISYQLLPELILLYQGTALDVVVNERMAKPAAQMRLLIKQHVAWYQQLQQQCGTAAVQPSAE